MDVVDGVDAGDLKSLISNFQFLSFEELCTLVAGLENACQPLQNFNDFQYLDGYFWVNLRGIVLIS